MEQKPSRKHHYIPKFYLKRWAGIDGNVCRFVRFGKEVREKRIHPSATGYMDRLYEIRGLPAHQAQRIETTFFSPVDDLAASALALMEKNINFAQWDSKNRSAWTRFILSLLMRCPEDIDVFKEAWRRSLLKDDRGEWNEKYKVVRTEPYPDTFQKYMEALSNEEIELSAMETLIKLIDHEGIGSKINAMIWHVLPTVGADFKLLTSDRPVIMTNGLLIPNGHIAIPLGPDHLFVASSDRDFIDNIIKMPVNKLVRNSNRAVVEYAQSYVYAVDNKQSKFVKNRMSTKKRPRLIELQSQKI